MSRIVGPISSFFEIVFFPKMEKYWAVPPSGRELVFNKVLLLRDDILVEGVGAVL